MKYERKLPDGKSRGRKNKTPVDRFQTMAWYNSLVYILETPTPNALEVLVERVKKRQTKFLEKKSVEITTPKTTKLRGESKKDDRTRAFDDYRTGEVSPSDGLRKEKLSSVMAAEILVPESGEVFRHLLWKIMKTKSMSYEAVLMELKALKPGVRAQYIDMRLTESGLETMLTYSLSKPLHVFESDFRAAMDHLAVQLMFLRLDVVRHLPKQKREIALNIAITLKPLALSPWIGPFYEKMFDWLEENVWGDLFDTHYDADKYFANGWRKIISRTVS